MMEMEMTAQPEYKALTDTDRALRRLLRQLKEIDPSPNEELETLVRRARRQLRANQQLLEDGAESTD